MDYNTFAEKLAPFFTGEQILQLNAAALESAMDYAHREENVENFDDETREALHFMGREVLCLILADNADDRETVERLAGSAMRDVDYSALLHQMDIEW